MSHNTLLRSSLLLGRCWERDPQVGRRCRRALGWLCSRASPATLAGSAPRFLPRTWVEEEAGTLARFGVRPYPSPVSGDDALHGGQAPPRCPRTPWAGEGAETTWKSFSACFGSKPTPLSRTKITGWPFMTI